MVHRHFDRPRLQHLGALRGEFEHLLVGYSIELARLRNDARVRGIDPVHIGENIAALGAQGRRQRHRRGGDPPVRADALETRQHRDLARFQPRGKVVDRNVEDTRPAMHGVGADRHLPTEPGAGG